MTQPQPFHNCLAHCFRSVRGSPAPQVRAATAFSLMSGQLRSLQVKAAAPPQLLADYFLRWDAFGEKQRYKLFVVNERMFGCSVRWQTRFVGNQVKVGIKLANSVQIKKG